MIENQEKEIERLLRAYDNEKQKLKQRILLHKSDQYRPGYILTQIKKNPLKKSKIIKRKNSKQILNEKLSLLSDLKVPQNIQLSQKQLQKSKKKRPTISSPPISPKLSTARSALYWDEEEVEAEAEQRLLLSRVFKEFTLPKLQQKGNVFFKKVPYVAEAENRSKWFKKKRRKRNEIM
jgi:hypothetical protein